MSSNQQHTTQQDEHKNEHVEEEEEQVEDQQPLLSIHEGLLAHKKDLILIELNKIGRLMDVYASQAEFQGKWDSRTKAFVVFLVATATATSALVGAPRLSPEFSDIVYYISITIGLLATILAAVTNTWSLGDNARKNTTTYRGLHNLHDKITSRLVRNHISSTQLDDLLENVHDQLSLIRDNAENGTYLPTITI